MSQILKRFSPARRALLATAVLLLALAAVAGVALAAGDYRIDWWTNEGGGGTSAGGTFSLSGTAGQPDAGSMAGGSYALAGGFWPGGAASEPNVGPAVLSLEIPPSGFSTPGSLLQMTGVYSDGNGWDDLGNVYLRISPTDTFTKCVYLRYDVQANRLYLRRPDDAFWNGGGTPGMPGWTRNNYGALDYRRTSVVGAGDVLSVTWAFTPTFRTSGTEHDLYVKAEDTGGMMDDWSDYGDWIINRAPTNIPPLNYPVMPTYTVGLKFSMDPRFRDLDLTSDLDQIYFAIADKLPTADYHPNGIYFRYDMDEDRIYLADSLGTGWGVPHVPKATEVFGNDAVEVTMRYTYAGDADVRTKILYLRLAFKPGYEGLHKVYMRATDDWPTAAGETGWKWKGQFTVEPAP